MARVTFTPNLRRHVDCPPCEAAGGTVREVLNAVFQENRRARRYVLDESGEVRKHMVVFVDGKAVRDRVGLTDPVTDQSDVWIMQALSGG
ncbi:MAG: MoaD/ThiS family protein [Phycisphaerae bacterium]